MKDRGGNFEIFKITRKMVFNFYFYLKGNYRVRRGDREKESEKGLQWQGLCHAKGRSQEASRSPV